jgi:hypothetical protein
MKPIGYLWRRAVDVLGNSASGDHATVTSV